MIDYTDVANEWDKQKPLGRSQGKALWEAIRTAIDKQIPVSPRIETTKEVPRTHTYGRLLYFYCPRCGKYLVGIYETDPERGGGIHPNLNGCSRCLQAIDFSQWKHKSDEDELVLED